MRPRRNTVNQENCLSRSSRKTEIQRPLLIPDTSSNVRIETCPQLDTSNAVADEQLEDLIRDAWNAGIIPNNLAKLAWLWRAMESEYGIFLLV